MTHATWRIPLSMTVGFGAAYGAVVELVKGERLPRIARMAGFVAAVVQ